MLVEHIAEMTLAWIIVLVTFSQSILRKLEHNGDQDQQLLDNVFRDLALKLFNLGTVLVDDLWLCTL